MIKIRDNERITEVTEVANIINDKAVNKVTKKVRLFLSFDPLKTIEGSVTIPGQKARLSDVVNDERQFLSLSEVVVPGNWIGPFGDFVLLNKKDVKAIVEID